MQLVGDFMNLQSIVKTVTSCAKTITKEVLHSADKKTAPLLNFLTDATNLKPLEKDVFKLS